MEYRSTRKILYERNLREHGNLINKKNPYTYLKSIFYMEIAVGFLFLTQKIIKNPNTITLMYIFSGLIGAILLNSTDVVKFIGIWLIFSKGVFDWADGTLAKYNNKKSFLGHVLAVYGGILSDVAFRAAFIYYTLSHYQLDLLFLFPVFMFILMMTDFRLYSDFQYLKKITDVGELKQDCHIRNNEFEQSVRIQDDSSNLKKWYFRYISFLDSRARSIDSLLLVLLIDFTYNYDLSMLLLTLSLLIILRAIIMYIAGVYFSFKVYDEGGNG
jgi:hypothetical protein